ncbi:Uncharacterized protein FWK35_00028913, partial [Aphis craccivora]
SIVALRDKHNNVRINNALFVKLTGIQKYFTTCGGPERAVLRGSHIQLDNLSTFSTDMTSQLNVFWHDRDTLGVDSAQVVRFAGLLQRHDGRALETQIGLEVLSDLTHMPLGTAIYGSTVQCSFGTTDLTERSPRR